MTKDEHEPSRLVPSRPKEAPSTQEDIERRRPGRLKDVSPRLISLLRFKHPAGQMPAPQEPADDGQPTDRDEDWDRDHSEDDERDDDDLGIAQGIVLAVLLSIPLWLALAVFWYLV